MSALIVPLLSPDLTLRISIKAFLLFRLHDAASGDQVGKRLSEGRIWLARFWRVPDAAAPFWPDHG